MFGEDYRREILPCAETVVAKTPLPAHRQLREGQRVYKGQPIWITGIWVGRFEILEEHFVGGSLPRGPQDPAALEGRRPFACRTAVPAV